MLFHLSIKKKLVLVLVFVIIATLIILFVFLTRPKNGSLKDYNYYYGAFHNHTGYSDADTYNDPENRTTPRQAYEYARDIAHLDWLGLCDHGEMLSTEEWADTLVQADKATKNGVFVAMRGFEWGSTHKNGHVCVFGTDTYCVSPDFDKFTVSENPNAGPEIEAAATIEKLAVWLEKNQGIATFNHPGRMDIYGGDEFTHFNTPPSDRFIGMELFGDNGFFDEYYYGNNGYYGDDDGVNYLNEAIQRGWKIGAGGGFDEHANKWGTASDYRLCVLADALQRDSLMDALKERRFFTTSDDNLKLYFDIGGSVMGSAIDGKNGTGRVLIQAADGDNESFKTIELLKNGVVIKTWEVEAAEPSVTLDIGAKNGDYFYCIIRQADGGEAISSSIWIGQSSEAASPTKLTASMQTADSITLTWEGPANAVKQYEIYRGGALINTTTSTTYTDKGLTAGIPHSYYIKALDTAGKYTAASNTIQATTNILAGDCSNGTSADSCNKDVSMAKYTASQSGTATRIVVSITKIPTSVKVKCAIYSDNNGEPGALLQMTDELTSPGNGWQEFILKTSVGITAGTDYWLAVWADNGGIQNIPGKGWADDSFSVKCTADEGNGRYLKTTYGDWPTPMTPMAINNVRYCMYLQ